jgi:phospholipase/lecithinase/hemolysin
MHNWRVFAVLLAASLAAAAHGQAQPFNQLIVFGDSLSDVGNAYGLAGQPPSPPYYQGRFSNGPVWVERLAGLLNVPVPTPAFTLSSHPTDYAIGGAQMTGGVIPSLESQVGIYLQSHKPTGSELMVLWAGANDFFNGQTNPVTVANALKNQINTLAKAGAKDFLVVDLPPLELTPGHLGAPGAPALGQLVKTYNADLTTDLAALRATYPSAHIQELDVYPLYQQLIANPPAYGLTNVTGRALNGNTVVPNADQYLYWDDIHPTQTGHELLAEAAAAVLAPEPTAMAWLGAMAIVLTRNNRRPRATCKLDDPLYKP